MARKTTLFVCQECGANAPKWSGKCTECHSWGSMMEEAARPQSSERSSSVRAATTRYLHEVDGSEDITRFATGSPEADQVLGGGIVPGSVLLLAGEPGIGKSTLLLQIAANVARGGRVLYVSGEESVEQIKLRADRLGVGSEHIESVIATDVDAVAATLEQLRYDLVIVDSIQTMQTARASSNPGTVSQITTTTHILQEIAKSTGAAVLVVGHVTKEGNIAGPKILEHLVDVVLHLEGERFGGFKLLRGVKNRFGATHEVGVFEMQEHGLTAVSNPSARFLQERQPDAGSVVCAAMEGTRALLVEVQALVNASPFGYPKRTSVGFDSNRLNVLIAVLGQRAGVKLGDKDVYVNIVGGMRLEEPAADLAVAVAIASAARQRPCIDGSVVFGEVGLNGEVRSVSHVDTRLKEAKKLKFHTAIAPQSRSQSVQSVASLQEAIRSGLTSS